MQKVYDINITFVDRQGDSDDGVTYEFYEVRYKILYNNGTYRDDIGAGEVRATIAHAAYYHRMKSIILDCLLRYSQ